MKFCSPQLLAKLLSCVVDALPADGLWRRLATPAALANTSFDFHRDAAEPVRRHAALGHDRLTVRGRALEMGARAYSPILGRFLQIDSIENGASLSFYGYVNDPINDRDLKGRIGWKKWWKDHGNQVLTITAVGLTVLALTPFCAGACLVAAQLVSEGISIY